MANTACDAGNTMDLIVTPVRCLSSTTPRRPVRSRGGLGQRSDLLARDATLVTLKDLKSLPIPPILPPAETGYGTGLELAKETR